MWLLTKVIRAAITSCFGFFFLLLLFTYSGIRRTLSRCFLLPHALTWITQLYGTLCIPPAHPGGLVQASTGKKLLPQLSGTPCLSRAACCSPSYLLQRNEHLLLTTHLCWKHREVCRSAISVNVNVSQSSPYFNHHSQSFSVHKGNKTFLIGSYMSTNLFAAHLSF